MAERLETVSGVELCLETFGDPEDPALLLIGGAAASMDWWDSELCQRLADEGHLVIRYDHRDTGRSETSPEGRPEYSADDLANDPLRLLSALGIDRAHLVGLSMGGGIAQQLAAHAPERVLTLTLIATSPAGDSAGCQSLPPMEPRLAARFAEPSPDPHWNDRAAVIDHLVESERLFAGPRAFDEERIRRLAGIVFDRTRNMGASMKNHWILSGDDSPAFRLADIRSPTLVLHGTADPLFPFAHGECLAAEIPNAALVPLPGMGHQTPPPPLWDLVVRAITQHTSGHRALRRGQQH